MLLNDWKSECKNEFMIIVLRENPIMGIVKGIKDEQAETIKRI